MGIHNAQLECKVYSAEHGCFKVHRTYLAKHKHFTVCTSSLPALVMHLLINTINPMYHSNIKNQQALLCVPDICLDPTFGKLHLS